MIKVTDEPPDGGGGEGKVCGKGVELPRPLQVHHSPCLTTWRLSEPRTPGILWETHNIQSLAPFAALLPSQEKGGCGGTF